jgi:TolA-binding protein
MYKHITILLLGIAAFAAEPSAFGAGDLDAPNPYGLTSSEKVILKNKKEVKTLSTNISFVKTELNDMQEKIDGIKSVVEAQNNRIYKIEQSISSLKSNDKNNTNELQALKKDLNVTKEMITANNKKVKLVLSELSSLIDSINASYVSKDTLDQELKIMQDNFDAKISALEKKLAAKSILSKKGSVIFKEAKVNFEKKNYAKSAELFKVSIKKRYLPATSNFYLGEINYRTKHYAKAIEYYKKSISLYDKASFTPTLLYHTYISFKKLGDKKNAKKFKDILIVKYPKSKVAKLAKRSK